MAVRDYLPAVVATAGGILIIVGVSLLFGAWGFIVAGGLLVLAVWESSR